MVCDIMSIDFHGLFLGRPWQYDLKAVHDGRNNRYIFEKDGKIYTLIPL